MYFAYPSSAWVLTISISSSILTDPTVAVGYFNNFEAPPVKYVPYFSAHQRKGGSLQSPFIIWLFPDDIVFINKCR